MSEYLPKQYVKEDKIFDEVIKAWKPLVNMDELNAKYRYVQLCRSLKTYGITCFDVSLDIDKKSSDVEMKKLLKRKLGLGITREAIMILDGPTKVICFFQINF